MRSNENITHDHEECEEITAGFHRAAHAIKKRGKRDAESAVREYNNLKADPSLEKIRIYVQRRAAGTVSQSTSQLGDRFAIAVRDLLAKLGMIVSWSDAIRADELDDCTELLIRGNYSEFNLRLARVEAQAQSEKLSTDQVRTFSPGVTPGLLTTSPERKRAVNMQGFHS